MDKYQAFGRLRNSIQHFASPDEVDCSETTLEFIYEVIDPFINDCWGLYAIDFNEDHEPYIYLIEGLISRGITFLVSPDSVKQLKYVRFEWPKHDSAYRLEMERRFTRMGLLLENGMSDS